MSEETRATFEDAVEDVQGAVDSPDVQNVVADIPLVVRETKAGWKTTEFWITLAGLAAVNLNGVVLTLPDKYQALASAVLAGLYALSRGQAKKGVADIEPGVPGA